ncbi:MAG: hypothetical protein JW818_00530 [Pirellulales bacterium]|nr:hypothetical protein [Pirellulales bacterium]
MSVSHSFRLVGLLLSVLLLTSLGHTAPPAGPAKEKKPVPPKIADGPKTYDPAEFLPAPLAKRATVKFDNTPLSDVAKWLREKQQIATVFAKKPLEDIGLPLDTPISVRLKDEPVYLLLNRLRSQRLGLGWYFEEDILFITTEDDAKVHLTTFSHSLGDLLDDGYSVKDIVKSIQTVIDPENWKGSGSGEGDLFVLKDVLVVRQTCEMHAKVRGLLTALQKHGRQTFACNPSQHLALRQKLEKNISVAAIKAPLDEVVDRIGVDAGVEIRFDYRALEDLGLDPRTPVTFELGNRKARCVLEAMLNDMDLSHTLRDGLVYITSRYEAKTWLKTAVYDVRDLLPDDDKNTLIEAIQDGTNPDDWMGSGSGEGDLVMPKPGVLAVMGPESLHRNVFALLQMYREALKGSTPRKPRELKPGEITTIYYRLHEDVARDLEVLLPKLVRPESWKSDTRPDAPGTILRMASDPELFTNEGKLARKANEKELKDTDKSVIVRRSVLIIQNTEEVHKEIVRVLQRVKSGDYLGNGRYSGGMGMFSVPGPRRLSCDRL